MFSDVSCCFNVIFHYSSFTKSCLIIRLDCFSVVWCHFCCFSVSLTLFSDTILKLTSGCAQSHSALLFKILITLQVNQTQVTFKAFWSRRKLQNRCTNVVWTQHSAKELEKFPFSSVFSSYRWIFLANIKIHSLVRSACLCNPILLRIFELPHYQNWPKLRLRSAVCCTLQLCPQTSLAAVVTIDFWFLFI